MILINKNIGKLYLGKFSILKHPIFLSYVKIYKNSIDNNRTDLTNDSLNSLYIYNTLQNKVRQPVAEMNKTLWEDSYQKDLAGELHLNTVQLRLRRFTATLFYRFDVVTTSKRTL